MAKDWCEHVNRKFYGQDGSFLENTEKIEFKGGRTILYLKNERATKKHTVNIRLADKGTDRIEGKTEFEWFLYWFENVIKSGTESFMLPDIITGDGEKEYMITESPTWNGQRYKEISLTLQEV
ncbi:MAG: hypothetical protein IJ717_00880 [Treponema sp.]|nr:hypothetical protein [Treponema sp.]